VAVEDRTEDADLSRLAFEEPYRFSFPQLVRLLLDLREGAAVPGEGGPPGRETVRFRPALSLGFADSDVSAVDRSEDLSAEIPVRYRVTVNFFGIYGPASPMPNHFTEDLLWDGIDAQALRDFLDLFNHRLTSFLYRGWLKYRYSFQYAPGATDPMSARMFSLIGLGTPGMKEALGIPLPLLLRGAGLLGGHARSAGALRGFLEDQFDGVPVAVETFHERTLPIPREQCARLGSGTARLGMTACLGERVIDHAGAFRVVLGPLGVADAARFLPGRDAFRHLVSLTRYFITDPLEFDLAIRVKPETIAPLRLGGAGDQPLGELSWIAHRGDVEGFVVLPVLDADPVSTPAGPSRGAGVHPAPPPRAIN
jgi:type VI secretion system protein ImpH